MTSTMKSEVSFPLALASSVGIPVSAAAIRVLSRCADGRRTAADFGNRGGGTGAVLRYRGGGAGDGDTGHEFAAADIRTLCTCQILARHEFLPCDAP